MLPEEFSANTAAGVRLSMTAAANVAILLMLLFMGSPLGYVMGTAVISIPGKLKEF
ncbi:hypothetical protein D3C74_507180 [compost metagenome]